MRNVPRAIALKLAQTLAFSLTYAASKLAGPVPTSEIVFFRGLFALLPLFAWTAFTVGPFAAFRTRRPLYHVVRSCVGTVSLYSCFAAIKLLALATFTAFSFLQPVFAVILAALFLGERVGPWRWGAVAIGFAGVLLMIEPHGGLLQLVRLQLSPGIAYALAFAFLTAVVVILIRQMSAFERGEAIVFYFMSTCAAVGALGMIWQHPMLGFWPVFWLILCGVTGGLGQIFMTYSYRYAEPSLLASYDYAAMLWATLLGYFVFAEVPSVLVLSGAGLVIAAGLLIAWRERHHLTMQKAGGF